MTKSTTKNKKAMRARRTTGKGSDSPTASTAGQSRVRRVLRDQLRKVIDLACIARGEAQWTSGYRAGLQAEKRDAGEDERLYRKQMEQYKHCETVENQVERAMAALLRAK